MADIKKNIRFYQPNDPYYWEVDNLPLTDLLSNDMVLENRIRELEDALDGFGDPDLNPSGSFSTGILSDLKAYAEPASGTATNFGKVFVRPGKFTCRMQLPATRESGWRMSRDKDAVFNNESFLNPGTDMLATTTITGEFVRETQGVARTAIVEFYQNADETDKHAAISTFDAEDFNLASPPSYRLDLIFIKGSKSLDTDGDTPSTAEQYKQDHIPAASIGVIKGAYFRTDSAGGIHLNGTRFSEPVSRLSGRTTGLANTEIPINTALEGFGTVPMPEDLANFAWHRNYYESAQDATNTTLGSTQILREASFVVPVAYVLVPQGYVAGNPIPNANIYDIRPFLRSAELSYGERAAIAASVGPQGENPFITKWHLINRWITPMQIDIDANTACCATNTGGVTGLLGRMAEAEEDIDALELSVSGLGATATSISLNHEGRLQVVEANSGGAPANIVTEHTAFRSTGFDVFGGWKKSNQLGSDSSPVQWIVTNAIPANLRSNIVAIQFRIMINGNGYDTSIINRLRMHGGVQVMHDILRFGISQSNGDIRNNDAPGPIFYHDVTLATVNNLPQLSIFTACTGSTEPDFRMYVDGYIYKVFTAVG